MQTKALLQGVYLASALQYVVSNILCVEGAVAVRVGRGARRILAMPGADSFVLCTWAPGRFEQIQFLEHPSAAASAPELYGEEWSQLHFLQIYISNDATVPLTKCINRASMHEWRRGEHDFCSPVEDVDPKLTSRLPTGGGRRSEASGYLHRGTL